MIRIGRGVVSLLYRRRDVRRRGGDDYRPIVGKQGGK